MLTGSPWFLLTLCVLATWRVSHLVAHEDGPFDVVVRLRVLAGDGMLGRLMDCPYCLSLWIAAPAALSLARGVAYWCLAWLAISGGSTLLETLVRRATPKLPHDGALQDVLWTETSDGDNHRSALAGDDTRPPAGPHA